VPELAGGAFWIPPGEPKRRLRDTLAEFASLFPGIGVAGLRRGLRIDALMDSRQPEQPHWYLEVLSIAPEAQRMGHGSALLQPVLARCDRDSIPAHLETNRESNLAYYRRFGFELTEKLAPEDGPPIWFMWREPRVASPG
jgi:ribosomal protein S18 acetylase RimI-like enzyme